MKRRWLPLLFMLGISSGLASLVKSPLAVSAPVTTDGTNGINIEVFNSADMYTASLLSVNGISFSLPTINDVPGIPKDTAISKAESLVRLEWSRQPVSTSANLAKMTWINAESGKPLIEARTVWVVVFRGAPLRFPGLQVSDAATGTSSRDCDSARAATWVILDAGDGAPLLVGSWGPCHD